MLETIQFPEQVLISGSECIPLLGVCLDIIGLPDWRILETANQIDR